MGGPLAVVVLITCIVRLLDRMRVRLKVCVPGAQLGLVQCRWAMRRVTKEFVLTLIKVHLLPDWSQSFTGWYLANWFL
jgi:hypothetical protein